MPLLPGLADYNIPVINTTGEEAPPFAILEAHGWDLDNENQDFVEVRKPTSDGKVYLVNGPFPLGVDESTKVGMATGSWGAKAQIQTGTTPEIGQSWTPRAGEWFLEEGEGVFTIVGDQDDDTVRVAIGMGGGGSNRRFALLRGEVGPVAFPSPSVAILGQSQENVIRVLKDSGTGLSYLVDEERPLMKALSTSYSTLRGSPAAPVLVQGRIINSDGLDYFLVDAPDLRILPNYEEGTAQAPYQAGDGRFLLGHGECSAENTPDP